MLGLMSEAHKCLTQSGNFDSESIFSEDLIKGRITAYDNLKYTASYNTTSKGSPLEPSTIINTILPHINISCVTYKNGWNCER